MNITQARLRVTAVCAHGLRPTQPCPDCGRTPSQARSNCANAGWDRARLTVHTYAQGPHLPGRYRPILRWDNLRQCWQGTNRTSWRPVIDPHQV